MTRCVCIHGSRALANNPEIGGDKVGSQRILMGVLTVLLAGLIGFLLGRIPYGDRELARPLARQSPLSQQPPGPSGDTVSSEQFQPLRAAVPEADHAEKSAPMISFTNHRLSVHVQNRLLNGILEKISHLSNVPIILSEGIKAQVVSSHFDDLPLEQGLRVLLHTLDAFFFYASQGQAPPALQAVWVYPQGQGKRMVPMPPEAWASMAEMREYLHDSDPDMRARAAEVLVERYGKRALDTVLEALEDGEEKVRYRTLAKAVQAGVPLRSDFLRHLLGSDPSPVVRFLALEALAKAPDIQPQALWESVTLALHDSHEGVQEQARILLEELEAADSPAEPDDPLQAQLQERSRRAQ